MRLAARTGNGMSAPPATRRLVGSQRAYSYLVGWARATSLSSNPVADRDAETAAKKRGRLLTTYLVLLLLTRYVSGSCHARRSTWRLLPTTRSWVGLSHDAEYVSVNAVLVLMN